MHYPVAASQQYDQYGRAAKSTFPAGPAYMDPFAQHQRVSYSAPAQWTKVVAPVGVDHCLQSHSALASAPSVQKHPTYQDPRHPHSQPNLVHQQTQQSSLQRLAPTHDHGMPVIPARSRAEILASAPTYAAPDQCWFQQRQQQWQQRQQQQQQELNRSSPQWQLRSGRWQSVQQMDQSGAPAQPDTDSRSFDMGGGEQRRPDPIRTQPFQQPNVHQPGQMLQHSFDRQQHEHQVWRRSTQVQTQFSEPQSQGLQHQQPSLQGNGICSLTLPTVNQHVRSLDPPPPPPNNDNATRRCTPPPASSSTFIHDNHPACTELSSFSPQSLLQYDKLIVDVCLEHAPDFDTSWWTSGGTILIPVGPCPTESEYHGPEIKAILHTYLDKGTSFSITGNYSMNVNDLKDHRIILEKKYPRIESDGVIFPLMIKYNKYLLPIFKGSGKRF
jgi:hypothetical protein